MGVVETGRFILGGAEKITSKESGREEEISEEEGMPTEMTKCRE